MVRFGPLGQFRRHTSDPPQGELSGPARIDRRTKDLIPRLQPGDIAVIDHEDLDRVAAEGLVAAGAAAVINASSSLTGRYPNPGPLVVIDAGLPLIDEVGGVIMDRVLEGQVLTLDGSELRADGVLVGRGRRATRSDLEQRLTESRSSLDDELERFAENTLDYLRREQHVVTSSVVIPELEVEVTGRHVLLVVRGIDYRDDLEALRRAGYLSELRPITIGVDGGADALLDMGIRPDIILGDFDSVSKDALRTGAQLVVHAYRDGVAPGSERLERLGFEYVTMASPGTSEDAAMLLAWELGAELIVAVGTHTSMAEFLDKGREGMASTFLTRMRVGSILVDAKGVSRLYQSRVRKRDLGLLTVSALVTVGIIAWVSEPIRLVLRTLWLSLQ